MAKNDPFRDFHIYQARFTAFHSAAFFTYPGEAYLYPAPPAVFYKLFFLFAHPKRDFLLALTGTFALAAGLFAVKLLSRGIHLDGVIGVVSVAAACSFPFYFDFEQGNIEWIVWLFVMLGIWGIVTGHGYFGAVSVGMAAAMKFYPILFACLFLSRRQYRQAAVAIAVTVVSTVVSLWLLCPDIGVAWRGTQAGLAMFRQRYILAYEQVGFDHSLFAVPKAILLLTHQGTLPGPETLAKMLTIYLVGMAAVGAILYWVAIRRLPLINQVICLTVATIMLPPVSYDYTLLHLYVPWAMLVLLAAENPGHEVRSLMAAMVCFAILFAPETELILHGRSYGGQVKAVALVLLFGIALLRRFPSIWDGVQQGVEA